MALGMALLLAAASLLAYNLWQDRAARLSAEQIMPQVLEQIEVPDYIDPYDRNMREAMIDGYAYIGYLSIPSQELRLPVMSEWDYNRLTIAPCRYHGSTKSDDLVIAAHNYSCHFGPIKNLIPGDRVRFTDMDGVVSVYEVAQVEILQPAAIEEMISGEFDLTLFTCTYGGKTRVTVRCKRITTV